MTQLRQFIRLILAAIIAVQLSKNLQWNEAYWIIISALLGLEICSFSLPTNKALFLLCTGLLASLTTFISFFASKKLLLIALYLFFTTFCTVSVGLYWPPLWGAAFVVNFFGNLAYVFSSNLAHAQQRSLAILIGFAIALLLQTLFFPIGRKNEALLVLANAVQKLIEMNQAIFNCYIASDYADKQFSYAKNFHEKRRMFAYQLTIARELVFQIKPPAHARMLEKLCKIESLYEIMLSMATLINREPDHSTFSIVSKEFMAITENIHTDLRMIKILLLKKKVQVPTTEDLQENIYQLEDINRSAVNVAAKDPLVFLLFVQDLYALDNAMRDLRASLLATEAVR